MPRYTGRVADWIMNKEAPEAFTNAITAMALLTFARLVHLTFLPFLTVLFAFQMKCD